MGLKRASRRIVTMVTVSLFQPGRTIHIFQLMHSQSRHGVVAHLGIVTINRGAWFKIYIVEGFVDIIRLCKKFLQGIRILAAGILLTRRGELGSRMMICVPAETIIDGYRVQSLAAAPIGYSCISAGRAAQ